MVGTVITSTTPSPSQASEAALNDPSGGYSSAPLTFPATLTTEWSHIIHFQRYEYSRSDARSEPTETRAGSLVSLPIPVGLEANYSANWENAEIGALGNQVANAAGEVFRDAMKRGGTMGAFKDALTNYAATDTDFKIKSALQAAGLDTLRNLPGYDSGSRATGLAINPYKAVLYRSPDFRSFNFSYKLMPTNKQEAETIRLIGKEFKLGMHPSFAAAFEDNVFKYPDVWRITIPQDKYLFKMLTCALTNMNINFHSEGTKSYFRDATDSIPMSVTLDLSFQEISVLTKTDIDGGY